MGRTPCCSKVGLHRGPWTPTEDTILSTYILTHGEGQWRSLPTNAGLLRCGKSCRLRWMNYLRPGIKRGDISPDEDDLIIRMHALLGNRWSLIAGRLPGRTDNEIKNYWNTHLSKQLLSQGTDPVTHKKLSHPPPKPKRKPRPKKKRPTTTTVKPLTTVIKPDEQVKVVVYQPKPSRVKSLLTVSSLSRSSSSSMTRNSSFESSLSTAVAPPCYDLCARMVMEEDPEVAGGRVGFLIGEDDLEPLPPHVSSDLDNLYQEYFQLIKADHHARDLDSFAHSLLI